MNNTLEHDCEICNWIVALQNNDSPFLIREFETGYAVISKYQYEYTKGYILFLCKKHVHELHELDDKFKLQFLKEMSDVAKALYLAVKPDKLNYEMLGNTVAHAHWHIFPRYKADPRFHEPIWKIDKEIRQAENTFPSLDEVAELRSKIVENLTTIK